jgi:hypothetical protein
MTEYTKISFNHRKEISDYSDLVELLFPGNHNQQHAATCIFFELKWTGRLVSNFSRLEKQHLISRRILQRSRAKLSRLGIIEHISGFNTRYKGQSGWKLSSRFEGALKRLAERYARLRNVRATSKEKDAILIDLMDARRTCANAGYDRNIRGGAF